MALPSQAHNTTATLLTQQAQCPAGDCHGSTFSCTNFLVRSKPQRPLKARVEGKLLEKIGVCSEIAFTRYVFSGGKPGPDPQRRVSDARLGRVPVRVYRPRAPSAGPWRASPSSTAASAGQGGQRCRRREG
ncbi:uncharacterized protein ACIB01_016453 [Guaruba guarouba]